MPYRVTEQGQQRRQAMRKSLVDAARELFVRQGYDATTMQEVVQKAGTSIGNCYFYFVNKEALMYAVVEDFTKQIALEIDAAASCVPAGPAQMAVALGRGVEVALEQGDLVRVLLTETHQPELGSLVLGHFTSRMPEFLKRGSLAHSPLEIPQIAMAYVGSVFNLLGAVITGDLEMEARDLSRFLVRWNFQALVMSPKAVEQGLAALDAMPHPIHPRRTPNQQGTNRRHP